MRRSGSSSCMLLPRQDSFGKQLSVTILNTEQLPKYSAERFFLLSELEQNGHSTVLLNDDDTQETDTQESSLTGNSGDLEAAGGFAPFILLYILWRPEISAQDFIRDTLKTSIRNLELLADIHPTKDDRLPGSLNRSSSRSFEAENDSSGLLLNGEQNQGGTNLKQLSSTSSDVEGGSKVYLVVERVCPLAPENSPGSHSSEDDGDSQRQYEVQVDLAEHLARMVATEPYLRTVCQGITVGVANHYHAAPGLEACVDALLVGSKDRRKHASHAKSRISVVSLSSDDLLGLGSGGSTDAVQGVLQCRVCAEWNGRGTLKTCAQRVHRKWRTDIGLPPDEARQHPFLKRKRAFGHQSDSLDMEASDLLSGLLTVCFWITVAAYLWENWREICKR